MTCEAEAEPPASFAWFDQRGKPIREGAILTENQISTLVVSMDFFERISDGLYPKTCNLFQLPITHDDIFGEYSCEATNKMGSLARKVKLSEGAKPGIPNLEIYKIDTESAQMTILVSIEELLSRKALKQFALYICRSIRRSYICVLSGLKLSTKKNIWIGIWRITNTSSKVSY